MCRAAFCICFNDLTCSIAACLKQTVTPPGLCNFRVVYGKCPVKSQCLPVTRIVKLVHCCTIQLHLWANILFRLVCKITKSFYNLHHICPSTCNNSTPTWWIFLKFYIGVFLKNLKKIQDSLTSDKNYGYFTRSHMHIYDNIPPSSS